MHGVRRGIAPLVVGMNGHVQAHEVFELGLFRHAEHMGKVGRPVQTVARLNVFAIMEAEQGKS